MEIKSSHPRQISSERDNGIFQQGGRPEAGGGDIFMDTELRMKTKIVPMFEEELKNRSSRYTGGQAN